MRHILKMCVMATACAAAMVWGAVSGTAATGGRRPASAHNTKASTPTKRVSDKGRRHKGHHHKAKRRTKRTSRKRTHVKKTTASATAAARPSDRSILVGQRVVRPNLDSNPAGVAEAFPVFASEPGAAHTIGVYLDARNRATGLVVALYTDDNGRPGSRLASGTLSSPRAGIWNAISVSSTGIDAGKRYWLMLLGKGGGLYFRDTSATDCHSVNAKQPYLTAAPRTWVTGAVWPTCNPSAYVAGSATPAANPTSSPPARDTVTPSGSAPASGGGAPASGSSTPASGTSAPAPANSAPASGTSTSGASTHPPVVISAPQVTGTAVQGQTLTTSAGTWTHKPTSYTYQWEDCDTSGGSCATISGATSSTYTLTSGQVGGTIRAVVTAANAGGSSSATSAATAVVTMAVVSPAPAAPTNTAPPQISGTATQSAVLTTSDGSWTGSPSSYTYQWEACDTSGGSCATISGATSSSYALTSGQVGGTVRAVVTAANAGGATSAASPATAIVTGTSAAPAATVVGAAGEPAVTCTTALNPGASIQAALASASAGQVVCLNGGTWSAQTLTGVTHSGMVTLAATPGTSVTIGGLAITGQTSNLTIEGLRWTGPFSDRAGVSNVVLQYNTLENLPDAFAVYSYPQSVGGNGVANGVQILYNQFDHIGSCVEVDGGSAMQENWTISHNVCGPDLGDGISSANDPSHYIQIGGVSGVTIDNNAFEGPYDAQGINDGPHNNVIHVWGTQSNVDIENNIIWHTDSRAQTILVEEGPTDNVTIKNNLDVEDPANFTNSNIYTMAWDINHSHGETIENNTAISPYWGTMDGVLYQSSSGDYSSTTNQTIEDNLVVPKASGGDANFNTSCASSCTYSDNVSGDGSAPGAASTLNWASSWQSTSWTPNSGSPWSPPPTGYYKPVGLAATIGYQGAIGP